MAAVLPELVACKWVQVQEPLIRTWLHLCSLPPGAREPAAPPAALVWSSEPRMDLLPAPGSAPLWRMPSGAVHRLLSNLRLFFHEVWLIGAVKLQPRKNGFPRAIEAARSHYKPCCFQWLIEGQQQSDKEILNSFSCSLFPHSPRSEIQLRWVFFVHTLPVPGYLAEAAQCLLKSLGFLSCRNCLWDVISATSRVSNQLLPLFFPFHSHLGFYRW